eukprot:CCRYP_018563-RA/>CCRYP_018563-RA protein AED:0.22 eAED:0.19 QI:0/0/0/1/0.33/0.25/4/0/1155
MAHALITYEEAQKAVRILPSLAPRPNAVNIRALSTLLEQRLEKIPCTQAPEHGFVGMVMPAQIYALRCEAPWTEWPDPGNHPAAANTSVEQQNVKTIYDANRVVFDSQENYTPSAIILATSFRIFARMAAGANKAWQQLKLHFEEAYELRLASGQGTAATHGYVNSATANDDDSMASIQESIANFHMANNANYQSMQDILQAARAETASLRAELQSTQQSFANFTRATPPAFIPPIPQFIPAPPTGQHQFTPPPAAPYQQYQQGGRGTRSRGGKGRNNRNRRGQTQQYFTPTTPATTFNAPSSALGVPPPAFQPPSTPPNPVKYYNNWNMCYSCGFDVEGWHTSATCHNKKQGHQDGCTRENAQAYKDAGHKVTWRGAHKTTLPGGATDSENNTKRITNKCVLISSTPTTNSLNYYAALQCEDTDVEDEDTVVASNVSHHRKTIHPTATTVPPSTCQPTRAPSNKCLQATQVPATQPITTRHQHYAIFDSGATAHFLVSTAHVVNKRPALKPLTIRLPNGKHIVSTHTCNLDLPWLPHSITEAHIVPGLSHSSLISTRKFCDAGCQVTLDQHSCKIYYQGALILTGTRDETTGLWKVPIHPHQPPHPGQYSKPSPPHAAPNCTACHTASNMYTLPSKQQQLKYMHQAFFSPPIATLLKAINNNQLQGFPLMTRDLVRKYLAPSPATSKGHMKRPRTGIRSTRSSLKDTPVAIPTDIPTDEPPIVSMPCPHVIPPDITDTTCNVFCFAALADKHHGTMYTDATGALPAVTLEGNQYYLVAYAYDPNYIYAIPLRNLRDDSIMTAFEHVFQDLKTKGYKPTFNVTDNQATTPIKTYLNTEDCKWQFVKPHNHRVNAAERAIQTFKNHFISGLCSTDSNWPLQLWDTMTEQAIITLNLLRTSRIDPSKSAYHQLHGHRYNWNAYPLAPPGTKAVIYDSPTTRTSWGTRGLDAWYCGPAFDHYRNMKFYVPSTKAYRVSGSYDLFPQHCILPTFTPAQHTQEVLRELFESLQTLDKPTKRKFLKKIAIALEIVNSTPEQRVTSEGDTASRPTNEGPLQWVVEHPTVTTSTNPTDPRELRTAPRTHHRATRNNVPHSLPPIVNPANTGTPRRSLRLASDEAPILPVHTVPSSGASHCTHQTSSPSKLLTISQTPSTTTAT